MKLKMRLCLCLGFLLFWSVTESQNTKVGGPCEGCEAIYEYNNKPLKSIDTLPGFKNGKNKIKISGIVYKLDGKTPAKNVILYVYHTDEKGRYPSKPSSKGWEKRHGYLRTWLITDHNGAYSFYTNRPASYPNSNIAQHIHITVKEPFKNEYYIDDFYFSDDPYVTSNIKNSKNSRGGYGVLTLELKGNLNVATRNITLGLHIPNY
jgi:protocatechuate 3,4-dioxygenase beta subunit